MIHPFRACLLAVLLVHPLPVLADQRTLEDVRRDATVFIECETDEGKVLKGSGALVSASGHVLTAKHVLDGNDPQDVKCFANIGTAAGRPSLELSHEETDSLDAILFLILDADDYEDTFLRYCRIEDRHQFQPLVSIGLPGRSKSKQISVRGGVLATTERAGQTKLLETDILTTAGMSGGPTVFAGNANLVGIVVEAEGDPLGTIAYYGILPVEQMNNDLTDHMTMASTEDCAPMRLQGDLDRALGRIELYEEQIAELESRFAALEATQIRLAEVGAKLDRLDDVIGIRVDIVREIRKMLDNENAAPDILDGRLTLFERVLEWESAFERNDLRLTYSGLAGNKVPPVEFDKATTFMRINLNGAEQRVAISVQKKFRNTDNPKGKNGGVLDLVEYKSMLEREVSAEITKWRDGGDVVTLSDLPPRLTLYYKLPNDEESRTETLELDDDFLRPLFRERALQ